MTQNIYKLTILRLEHRPFRDKRITTHCALVSRAFGAKNFYFSGVEDCTIIDVIEKINKKWGSNFKMEYVTNPILFIKEFKKNNGVVVHLTMYGENINKSINDIKNIKNKEILLIVGGSKVAKEYYELADFNVAIGSQPHSEVSALGIFLYMLDNSCLDKEFKGSKIKIIPNNDYKKVINL